MRRQNNLPGDKAALLALIGIAILFAFIVGRGWYTLISTYGLVASISVGVLMAAIALTLAYAIASERTRHEGSTTWIAYFFVLVNISALGAVNAMFVMFESTNVFRDEIDRANETVISLRDQGSQAINTSEFDKFRSDVNDRWRNLKAEIENPQLCGQGPVAAQRIVELQGVLPNFRSLAGPAMGKCEKTQALIAAYEKQISELVKESPVFAAAKKKIDLRRNIVDASERMLTDVGEIRSGLAGASLASTKSKLLDVAQNYSLARQELLSGGVTGIDKIPLKIDTRATAAIGDIGQLIPFILSRLGQLSTYIYIGFAVFLDIAAISAFSRVLKVGSSRSQRAFAGKLRRI